MIMSVHKFVLFQTNENAKSEMHKDIHRMLCSVLNAQWKIIKAISTNLTRKSASRGCFSKVTKRVYELTFVSWPNFLTHLECRLDSNGSAVRHDKQCFIASTTPLQPAYEHIYAQRSHVYWIFTQLRAQIKAKNRQWLLWHPCNRMPQPCAYVCVFVKIIQCHAWECFCCVRLAAASAGISFIDMYNVCFCFEIITWEKQIKLICFHTHMHARTHSPKRTLAHKLPLFGKF